MTEVERVDAPPRGVIVERHVRSGVVGEWCQCCEMDWPCDAIRLQGLIDDLHGLVDQLKIRLSEEQDRHEAVVAELNEQIETAVEMSWTL